MDRKKSETALRCLNLALHSNTADEEVLAAIAGFRRTAGNASLLEMAAALTDRSSNDFDRVTPATEWQEAATRLAEENQQLRNLLESWEEYEAKLQQRLDESERRVSEFCDASLIAVARVEKAESLLAELLTAYGSLSDENRDLRTALAAARRSIAEAPRTSSSTPFRTVLAAALSRRSQSALPTGQTAVARLPSRQSLWRESRPRSRVDGAWTA